MSRLRLLAGAVLAGALVAGAFVEAAGAVRSGASGESVKGSAAGAFKVAVAESGLTYSPKTAHVNKGRKVKWTNESGSAAHTVTFYKKPKGAKMKSFTLGPDAARKRTITKKGVYKYRCTVLGHSSLSASGKCTGMCGKVRGH